MKGRPLLRRIHWLFGISAGAVLAVMGVTGGLLEYQHELLDWLNPGVLSVAAPFPAAEPDRVLGSVRARHPGAAVLDVGFARNAHRSARVVLRPTGHASRRFIVEFVDPSNGRLLGRMPQLRGAGWLHGIESIHRSLGVGAFGKVLTGASTLILLFLLGSGLYLRWPQRWRDWRPWLRLDLRHAGRRRWWSLHTVIGGWVLPFYLIAALSGVFFAYDWARRPLFALAGQSPPHFGRGRVVPPPASPVALDPAWRSFVARVPDWREAHLRPPAGVGTSVSLRYRDAQAPHERAFGEMTLTPGGQMLARHGYARRNAAGKLVAAMFPLHTGSLFGLPGRLLMMASALSMPLFFFSGWKLYLGRRRARTARAGGPRFRARPSRPPS